MMVYVSDAYMHIVLNELISPLGMFLILQKYLFDNLNHMFMLDSYHCNKAVGTLVKYEHDIQSITYSFELLRLWNRNLGLDVPTIVYTREWKIKYHLSYVDIGYAI